MGENALERPRRIANLMVHVFRTGSVSTREAMELGDCSKKVALSDLKTLVDNRTLQVVGAGNKRRYVFSDEALPLRIQDRVSLLVGREVTRFLGESRLTGPVDLPVLTDRVRYVPEPSREYGNHAALVDDVLRALVESRTLHLVYQTEKGESAWSYDPLALLVFRRALYLVGRARGRTKTLAIERIQRVTVGAPFERPADWDLDRWLAPRFGLLGADDDAPEQVRIRFDASVAHLVRARVWHPSQVLEDAIGGAVVLRMTVFGAELVRFVREWGHLAEVLEPAWLRDEVRASLEQALARYPRRDTEPLFGDRAVRH